MQFQNKFRNTRRVDKRPAQRQLTAQQLAAAKVEAFACREEWRAELAARAAAANDAHDQASSRVIAPDPQKSARDASGRFAAALARAEFGRFYWSDKLAKQLAQSSRRNGRK